MFRMFLITFFVMIFFGNKVFATTCQDFASVKKMPIDTVVYVCGTISKNLQGEYYELKQKNNTIVVKIDNDFRQSPANIIGKKIQIRGIVDKERYPDYDEYGFSIKARTIQIGDSDEVLVEI